MTEKEGGNALLGHVESAISQRYGMEQSPEDFIQWVDECLDMPDKLGISNREYSNSREIKILREEAYPIRRFLSYGDGEPVLTISLRGNDESYDAIMKTEKGSFFIEVTSPKDGHLEHLQLCYLDKHDSVSLNGINKDALKDALKNGHTTFGKAELANEIKEKKNQEICKAIDKKLSKEYPENTVLIVLASIIFPKYWGDICNKTNSHIIENREKAKKFRDIYLVHSLERAPRKCLKLGGTFANT